MNRGGMAEISAMLMLILGSPPEALPPPDWKNMPIDSVHIYCFWATR